MNVNTALWIFLDLDDAARHEGASACVYVGMTPEQIKAVLDQPSGAELSYYLELAHHLGFNFERINYVSSQPRLHLLLPAIDLSVRGSTSDPELNRAVLEWIKICPAPELANLSIAGRSVDISRLLGPCTYEGEQDPVVWPTLSQTEKEM